MSKGYLYARSVPVNEKISIVVPTVGQILENEDTYNSLVTAITASPTDFMVQLDDMGIDFSTLTSFELFLMLFDGLKKADTSLVFGDLDLSRFENGVNVQNGHPVLIDRKNDIVIDRGVHGQICGVLRKINRIEKNIGMPANEEAKKYMIERARIKQQRAAKRPRQSHLEELIIAMVNTEQFKYGYEEVLGLTIYQFYVSVYQIIKKINYDNTMIGCYAGTVSAKNLSQDQLNWLTSK